MACSSRTPTRCSRRAVATSTPPVLPNLFPPAYDVVLYLTTIDHIAGKTETVDGLSHNLDEHQLGELGEHRLHTRRALLAFFDGGADEAHQPVLARGRHACVKHSWQCIKQRIEWSRVAAEYPHTKWLRSGPPPWFKTNGNRGTDQSGAYVSSAGSPRMPGADERMCSSPLGITTRSRRSTASRASHPVVRPSTIL